MGTRLRRRFSQVTGVGAFLFVLTVPCWLRAEAVTAKEEALKWIDNYRSEQVLFHDKDVQAVRDKLAAASNEEAQKWLDTTKEDRAALDSERWQTTRKWLKQFLKVQAIYSDEQVGEFRDEALDAVKTSPAQLKDLLGELENFRTSWTQGVAAAPELRKKEEQVINAYKKEVFAQREAARRQSAATAAGAGSGRITPAAKRQYTRAPALIDSLDVARWSVMRSFWRPR